MEILRTLSYKKISPLSNTDLTIKVDEKLFDSWKLYNLLKLKLQLILFLAKVNPILSPSPPAYVFSSKEIIFLLSLC